MKKRVVQVLVAAIGVAMLSTACVSNSGSKGSADSGTTDFPNQQMNMIVQSSAGGLSDQISREIADLMGKDLGQTMVCQYKPGGSGAVGMSYVQASNPDGYTIGHTPVEMVMLKNLGYADLTSDDLDCLGRAYTTVGALVIKAGDDRFSTIEEFIQYAKDHPGEVKIGNAGTGSIWHLGAIGLENAAGVTFNHVPFDGSSKSIAALMGGHVDACVAAPIELISGVDGKELTVLATMGDERAEVFSDVPTLKESGIDYTLIHWGGFAAPKGLDEAVRDKLVDSLEKAVNSDDFASFLAERGMEPAFLTGDEYETFISGQTDLYKNLIDEAGLLSK
ncbi:MAG: tripartite tricarboxylate transporter substrate binding protein [Hespellia sp.]|nr:tripartite tricarboxylate transporter substrate binding protein [Hespellia sp.]